MRFTMQPGFVEVQGPPGVMVAGAAVDACSDQTSTCLDNTASASPQTIVIGLVDSEPSANGALFTIHVSSTSLPPIHCNAGGCNGDGG
jgi:hypothetical protein